MGTRKLQAECVSSSLCVFVLDNGCGKSAVA